MGLLGPGAAAGAASGTAVAGLLQEFAGAVGFSGTALAGASQAGCAGGVGRAGAVDGEPDGGVLTSGNAALDCAKTLRAGSSKHTASSHRPTVRPDPTINVKL